MDDMQNKQTTEAAVSSEESPVEVSAQTEENNVTPSPGRWKRRLILALVFFLALGYLIGVFYFSQHSYPKTAINGYALGSRPLSDFQEIYPDGEAHRYIGRNAEITLDAQTIRLRYILEGEAPKQPSAWKWPLEYFLSHNYSLAGYKVDYDQERLAYMLKEAGFDPDGEPPKDAALEATAQGVRIKPEEQGDRVNMKALTSLIFKSISSKEQTIHVEEAYEKPKVTKDDPGLEEDRKKVEKLLASSITYVLGDKTYLFGPEEIFPLLKRNDSGEYSLPDDGITSFVVKMAKETDTYGTSREFETTGAGTVTVPPGIYGWQINVKNTVESMKEMLKKGGTFTDAEPVYNHTGLARGVVNDIGNTYIEIDLSRQHLWAYLDGSLLLDSPIRTGKVNQYNETPRGVHMIWSREKGRKLQGRYKDGTPYDSKVEYWMPINYGGVGLHDAPWVTAFGGDYYMYSGSNGCINLNLETAKAIYENYTNGTPVVIYESTTNYSPADHTF